MSSKNPISIHVHKRDGKAHYSWPSQVLAHDNALGFWMTAAAAGRELHHHTNGATYNFDTHAIELFWRDLPFSIGLNIDQTQQQCGLYCNIHEPFQLQTSATGPSKLSFIDLDLDIVVNEKHTQPTIIDVEEFEEHRHHYRYPEVYTNLIPAIAQQLQQCLKSHKAFQREQVLQLFKRVFGEPQKSKPTLQEPTEQQGQDLSQLFQRQPWPKNLLIPPELCKNISELT